MYGHSQRTKSLFKHIIKWEIGGHQLQKSYQEELTTV